MNSKSLGITGGLVASVYTLCQFFIAQSLQSIDGENVLNYFLPYEMTTYLYLVLAATGSFLFFTAFGSHLVSFLFSAFVIVEIYYAFVFDLVNDPNDYGDTSGFSLDTMLYPAGFPYLLTILSLAATIIAFVKVGSMVEVKKANAGTKRTPNEPFV